jgi:biotin carboxylase
MNALQKARELGFCPVFITRDQSWYPGLARSDYPVVVCETNRSDEVQTAIRDYLSCRRRALCAITTTSEFYLETAAALAHNAQLFANSPETIRLCRNKVLTRRALEGKGIPQPRFFVISPGKDFRETVQDIWLPCIVKPADATGSRGVKLCHTVEEVIAHVNMLQRRMVNIRGQAVDKRILCEEYIEAPEFSVETMAWNGEVTCVGITQKSITGFPYFVENGHIFPATLQMADQSIIEQTVKLALRVVGNTYGPMHTEVKLHNGECMIIEINARLGGDRIPELVRQAKGIDLLRNQILIACGRPPELNIMTSRYAGIYFFTAPHDGTFLTIKDEVRLRKDPDVLRVVVKGAMGDHVKRPKSSDDRLGFVIFCTETAEEAYQKQCFISEEYSVIIQ